MYEYITHPGWKHIYFFHLDRLVSSAGRASAFGAAGSGFESGPHHTIGVKMVQAARIKCFVPGI